MPPLRVNTHAPGWLLANGNTEFRKLRSVTTRKGGMRVIGLEGWKFTLVNFWHAGGNLPW